MKRIPTVQDGPAVLKTAYNSMVELLRARAAEQPDERAYVFLSDRGGEEASLTFSELERRAGALAAQLVDRGQRGERALLMFPPGLDFIVAFFGCLIAGMIAVPMMPPRRFGARDSSASIVADCTPRFALTSPTLQAARSDLAERLKATALDFIYVDATKEAEAPAGSIFPQPGPQDLAFLQYTSGSTSDPKGVMVSHGNLLANSEMIRLVYGNTRATTYVSWVPLYHDMGLILNVLQTLYVGSLCVLMAPVSFMQRPLTWLRAISDYRAEFATAPNFAFDLCVDRFRPDQMAGIDLSSWKIALNGAEPVRADNDGALHRDLRALRLRSEGVLPGLWARGGDAARLRRRTGTGARHAPSEPGGAATPSRSRAVERSGRAAPRGLRQDPRRRKARDRRSGNAPPASDG